MTAKPTTCFECGQAIQQPATGRPRRFCGPVCHRSANYRLRRLNRAVERLENEADQFAALAELNPSGAADFRRAADGARARAAERAVELRALVAAQQEEDPRG